MLIGKFSNQKLLHFIYKYIFKKITKLKIVIYPIFALEIYTPVGVTVESFNLEGVNFHG